MTPEKTLPFKPSNVPLQTLIFEQPPPSNFLKSVDLICNVSPHTTNLTNRSSFISIGVSPSDSREKIILLYSLWILNPLDNSSTAGIWGGDVREGRYSPHSFPSLVFWIWDGGGDSDGFHPKLSTPQNLQIPESFVGADKAQRRAIDFAADIVFQPRYGESKRQTSRHGKSRLLFSALSSLLCDPRCSRSILSSSFPLVFHCFCAGVFWLYLLLVVDLFFLNPNLNFYSLMQSNNLESGIACCLKISFDNRFEFMHYCSAFDYLFPDLLTPSFMRNVLMTLWCEVNLDIWIPWHFLCSFALVSILDWKNKVYKYYLTVDLVLCDWLIILINGDYNLCTRALGGFWYGFINLFLNNHNMINRIGALGLHIHCFFKWFELLSMNYKPQDLLNNQLLISGVGFHANTPGECFHLETIQSMTTLMLSLVCSFRGLNDDNICVNHVHDSSLSSYLDIELCMLVVSGLNPNSVSVCQSLVRLVSDDLLLSTLDLNFANRKGWHLLA